MKKIIAALLISSSVCAQNINLSWVHTEAYPQENANARIAIDKWTKDVQSAVLNVWVDINNNIHANALNRRNPSGVLIQDTVFDNNSMLDYRIRAMYPKNGETYFCLGYQYWQLIYQKMNAAGQILWTQSIPRANFYFSWENNMKGNTYVLDDSTNSRMLWCFEQWDISGTTKNIGILATDNATGSISIVDTISYPMSTNASFVIDIARDNSNHVYMNSMTENGAVQISLLSNGQLVPAAIIDSAGFRDYGQSMRICGNTLFVTSQVDISSTLRVNRLHIYSIAANGQLSLISQQTLSDNQHYILGAETFQNHCYVYTSGLQNASYPNLVPLIWRYDSNGNLVNTFTLSNYTGKCVYDISVTSNALYASMYTPGYDQLEAMNNSNGAHLADYNLLQEFSSSSNDGAHQIEAYTSSPNTDAIYVAGNKWISQQLFARLAKYTITGFKSDVDEISQPVFFSVSPNPSCDFVNVQFSEGGEHLIRLVDAQGRTVLNTRCSGDNTTIDLRNISTGLYLLVAGNEKQNGAIRLVREKTP